MRRNLVLWFALLIVGFLIGFILQYARLQRAQRELSASAKQLAFCQSSEQLSQLRDTATMMYLEAVQKNLLGHVSPITRALRKLGRARQPARE
jgi:hypothetical protein